MSVKKEANGRRSVTVEFEGPRHSRGSLASYRHRTWDFVLVRAD